MTTYGTSYFKSREAACLYFLAYEPDVTTVWEIVDIIDYKLDAGEIHIGKPELKPGQTLSLIDNGTRYAITEHL